MAFPSVATSATSTEDASNVTSHTVSLPSGISSGDLLIGFFSCDGGVSSITWPNEGTDWTEIGFQNNGSACTFSIAWRAADGTEGSSITVTTSFGERSAHCVLRITGAEDPSTQAPEINTVATGSSTSPDSTSLTPTGGAKDYMWISAQGHDRDRTTSGFPSNMTDNNLSTQGGGANSAGVGVATAESNAASFNPNAFTISASDEWVAFTVAVHPGSGATTKTKTLSADALLRKQNNLLTASADALLQKQGITATLSADALLIKRISLFVVADALLQKLGVTQTLSADALLQKLGITATLSADALLVKTIEKTLSADALLQKTVTATLSADALLQALDVTLTASADALLQKQGITLTTSVDALLLKTGVLSLSADALLQKVGVTSTASADALLQKLGITATLSADALLQKTEVLTLVADALLRKNNITLTASADALLQKTLTLTLSADAVLTQTGTSILSLTADALLQKTGITKTVSADAVLSTAAAAAATPGFEGLLRNVGRFMH